MLEFIEAYATIVKSLNDEALQSVLDADVELSGAALDFHEIMKALAKSELVRRA